MTHTHNPAMFYLFQHPAFGGLYYSSAGLGSSSATRVASLLSEFLDTDGLTFLFDKVATSYTCVPYHNLRHAKHVTDSADKLSYLYNIPSAERLEIVLAAMFHDAGHSGGKLPDTENVAKAADIAKACLTNLKHPTLNVDHVVDLIYVTAFNEEKRNFFRYPDTVYAKVLRDSDLLGFQYPDWPDLLSGLASEMGIKVDTVDRALAFLKEHLVFMRSVSMYTEFGKSVKDKYVEALTEALTCFSKC